ncbi:hypothetical protein N7488_006432 [Penicillium malachiteum]|nr:hypothetical protein N7488_006432 [Penicillium malachiteum]
MQDSMRHTEEPELIYEQSGRTVVRVDNNLVIKSGHLRNHEAETLQFIAKHTTIPVPKVHKVNWDGDRVAPLVMDYMPGQRLDKVRALKGNYIGALNRGKAIIGQISSLEGGPFDTEQDFNEFILGDFVNLAPNILREHCRFALYDNHEIVFTHGGLAPRSILVYGSHVTAILD